MAVNVKIGLIGALDMLKFKNMSKVREETIQAAPAREITANFKINNKAKELHPDYVRLIVSDIYDHGEAKARTIRFKSKDSGALPYFRAGEYLSLKMKIGESCISRAYSISSSPKDALEGHYDLTIRENKDGFAADYLLENVKIGDEFTASSPQGTFYYEPLRDPEHIIAIAGGSGITPFLSMARAIADGTEDFSLTIIFGSRTESQILFKEELDELASSCSRIKVVHVLSDEWNDNYEHGFITADLISRNMDGDTAVFICGPEAMYSFVRKELEALDLPAARVRMELAGAPKDIAADPNFPKDAIGRTFELTIRQGTEEYMIPARSEEPILVAVERAGITAPSRCRGGECGWCRSKVISGSYFAPYANEHRRWADKKHDYIHACVSFPVSDMVIEVPGEYI